jgi:hypothetical protein
MVFEIPKDGGCQAARAMVQQIDTEPQENGKLCGK